MMPKTGVARISPMNQEIDVHSSAEKFMLLTFIDLYVSPWYLELIKHVLMVSN